MKKQKSIPQFAVSVYVKNLVVKLFCFLLFFTFYMALGGKVGSIITQVLDLIILIVLIFSNAWETGGSDSNRVMTGVMKEDVYRGFKAGLLAAIPDFLTVLLLFAAKLEMLPRVYISVFGLLNAPFYPFHLTILPQTLTSAEQSMLACVISGATILLIPIITGFAYILGYYEYSILDNILYTTPEAKEKHKQKLIKRKLKKERRLY